VKGPPVSDLKSHLGFWLRFLSNHVSQRFARKVEGQGVTVAEWVVLREMFDVEISSPSGLASAIGMTRGAVSKLIDRLCEKRLVTRDQAANDRRYLDVRLTPAGRALVPKLAALADQNDAEFFSSLTPDERRRLEATLRKLVAQNKLRALPTK
jgi:DNA-binding MarR family transcriptional regulator